MEAERQRQEAAEVLPQRQCLSLPLPLPKKTSSSIVIRLLILLLGREVAVQKGGELVLFGSWRFQRAVEEGVC